MARHADLQELLATSIACAVQLDLAVPQHPVEMACGGGRIAQDTCERRPSCSPGLAEIHPTRTAQLISTPYWIE